MQDRPTARELIRGIYHFLQADLVPVLEEPLKFHTRVAANVLGIIEREIELEDGHLLEEGKRLSKLLGKKWFPPESTEHLRNTVVELNEEFSKRIRAGEADHGPWRDAALEHVRKTLLEKLQIADPRMIERAQRKA